MTPGQTHRLTLRPTLEDVARVVEAWERVLPASLNEHQRFNVAVALAEALTNIVEHGFQGRSGPDIELIWAVHPSGLVVEVRDEGLPIPRDSLDQAGPSTSFDFDPTDLGSLPEGGMGLGIIKTAFDHVAYARRGKTNCLRLGKRLT